MQYEESQSAVPEKLVLEPEDTLALPSGTYTVVGLLGEGGFGSVYEITAQDEARTATYALKVLDLYKAMPSDHESMILRFTNGFEAGRVNSEYVVRNHYSGTIIGNPYIIMDLCKKEDLSKRLPQFHSEQAYTELAVHLLKGLGAIHEKGVVHRDIKPENILFEDWDIPKISDFDIAEHMDHPTTQQNFLGISKDVWGTPVYAPPEQLDHVRSARYLKPSMDMFAFGITMYEVISQGHFPYGNLEDYQKQPRAFYKKVKRGQAQPLSRYRITTKNWEKLIVGCIDPNPRNRLESTQEALGWIDYEAQVEPAAQGEWVLEILEGGKRGERYLLSELLGQEDQRILTIGNSGDAGANDIEIEEEGGRFVSRRHATLRFTHQGRWDIRDGQFMEETGQAYWKNSTNGTAVNDVDIREEGGVIPLRPGDTINLGHSVRLRVLRSRS